MTIYLDAIFLLNLLFNYLILLLVQSLLRQGTSKWRLLFGAFVATLLVPITIYFPNSILTSVVGKVIYSIVIIFSSFKFVSLTQFIKLLLSFYFVSFGIGGGLIAIHFMMNHSFSLTAEGLLTYRTGFGDIVSWLFVLIGFPFVLLFTKFRMDRQLIDDIRYDETYSVLIEMKGQTFTTNGFIDSGNQLVDPITRSPVIICDAHFLQQFFTEIEWEQLKIAYEQFEVDKLPNKWKNRIFIVPFKGVGGSDNILFTIRADSLIITFENKQLKADNVLIGIQFSHLTADRHYQCLLHPKVVQRAKVLTV